MKHLRVVMVGMGTVLNPFGSRREYTKPKPDGFGKDFANLAGDWRQVGDDLTTSTDVALAKYHESTHYAASQVRR